jgi:plasmid stabilization system protein ParE
MPSWARKDERQYEHIRDSLRDEGHEAGRAEEIAARTVNKQRRREGRTPNKTTQGTGNPRKPLDDRTAHELRNLAARMHIVGRSRMKKAQLVRAIQKARG